MAFTETENIFGFVDKRMASAIPDDARPGTVDSTVNYNDVENLRARLTTIDGTYFSTTMLDRMTKNDMVFAVRINDDLAGMQLKCWRLQPSTCTFESSPGVNRLQARQREKMTTPELPDTTIDQGLANEQETVEQKPPYAEYLEGLPESIVPMVERAFKKWDADTTTKFQQVHSQYEPLKPWQQLQDNQISPDQAIQALTLLQKLQENPQAVYEEIGKAFGLGQQGQQEPQELDSYGEPGSLKDDPEFARMNQMTQAMAEYLIQQEDAKKQAAADAAIDNELTQLKQKHGDFDERFVVTQMMNGATGEQAVQMFQQAVNHAVAQRQRPSAPTIMNAGGGIPSQTVDVGKLQKKEVLSLVQQMLAQGAQEG